MTDTEKQDLDDLKQKCAQYREQAFSSMRNYSRLNGEELKHTGYKTHEAAMIGAYNYAANHITKLTAAYLKKYPDTRA
jgi:hypothetical protein